MKSLGYIGAFLGGAIAGAALGILVAPEKGQDTGVKITDAIEDFMKKHNIKLSRKEVGDLVDDIQDVADEQHVERLVGRLFRDDNLGFITLMGHAVERQEC